MVSYIWLIVVFFIGAAVALLIEGIVSPDERTVINVKRLRIWGRGNSMTVTAEGKEAKKKKGSK